MLKKIQIICATCIAFSVFLIPNANAKSSKAQIPNAANYLARGVWRTQTCNSESNFQKFSFARNRTPNNQVEVGFGELGSGEPLEIIKYGISKNIIEVQTRVCAPIGCNQTFEQYRILDANKMFEWTFEGHLPDQPPNIVVRNGLDKEGRSGRTFLRCPT